MQVLKPSRSRAVPQEPLMPKAASRMLPLLGALVVALPVGTNLGLLHLLWMVVSGRLLTTRGAVIPGLDACGLSRRAVRRAWAGAGTGGRATEHPLAPWGRLGGDERRWEARSPGGGPPPAAGGGRGWAAPPPAAPRRPPIGDAGARPRGGRGCAPCRASIRGACMRPPRPTRRCTGRRDTCGCARPSGGTCCPRPPGPTLPP